MVDKKDFGFAGYVLGVLSIVSGILYSNLGLVFGISGLIISTREKTDLAKKAKKLNIIGIITSIVVMIITVIIYLMKTGQIPSFMS